MAKIKDVEVGQVWEVRVSGNVTNTQVISIDRKDTYGGRSKTTVTLKNLKTNNIVTRSCGALRKLVATN